MKIRFYTSALYLFIAFWTIGFAKPVHASIEKRVIVFGQVVDSITGKGIENIIVSCVSDTNVSPFAYSYQYVTNKDGYFQDTIHLNEKTRKGKLIFSFSYENRYIEEAFTFRFTNRSECYLSPLLMVETTMPVPEFQAHFTFTNENIENNSAKISFTDLSIGENIDSWHWEFGDGNTSDLQNPRNEYSEEGVYKVKLTITKVIEGKEGALLISTITHPIHVYSKYESNIIGGQVFLGSSLVPAYSDYAKVLLYSVYETNGKIDSLTYIDESSLDYPNAGYSFTSITEGKYIIKAELSPESEYYGDYLITYYGNASIWEEAGVIEVINGGFDFDINLIEKSFLSTGDGEAEGEIIAENKEGGGIEDAYIILLNNEDQPVLSNNSDSEGIFGFNTLPYGTYKAYAEITGLHCQPIVFTVDEANPTVNNLQFVVTENGVGGSANGVENQDYSIISIYPNPLQDNFIIEPSPNTKLVIQIFNLLGEIVFADLVSQKTYINSSQWKSGVYFVKSTSGNTFSITKIVKK
jgi:hypothetical protein